ncbi:unnamed protein product [Acanthoscelides obtectus]|uniref:Cytochrome P450 n=1 Tax=Acanthoscelides obtectus TaxID=200917 RepID=A0A9P0MH13_ACAOB|nr:unnamed protein product [Acanthoscelides obtectus]CAK1620050.1 Probable cytochrome P450 6a23 [Acanthoscelides obtectus]
MDLTPFAYIIASLIAISYLYVKWAQSYWRRKHIQHLEPAFLYGNVKRLLKREISLGNQFQDIYNEVKSRGWQFSGYYFLTAPSLIVVDLELIKRVMQTDFVHFMNHGFFVNEEADPLSGHLFRLEDDKWRNVRVKLTPAFTSGKLKMMFSTMTACTEGLAGLLKENERLNGVVDIKDVLSRFTTDVIGSVGFGIDCNSINDPDCDFIVYGRKVFDSHAIGRRIRQTVAVLLPMSLLKAINFKLTDASVEAFFLNVVRNTMRYREDNNINRRDFMQLMLQLKNRGTIGEDDKVLEGKDENRDGSWLTENQIAAQCFVFFFAGFETSATTMTFALYELAVNQDIQEKLRREITEVLGRHGHQITYEAIMEMTYLDKIVHETLRKHPPIADIPRICTKDYHIPGTNAVIKKGTRVDIPVQGIHRDPDYYPDPEKFDPERFSDENKSKRHQYAFLPFGEGPRVCIGIKRMK